MKTMRKLMSWLFVLCMVLGFTLASSAEADAAQPPVDATAVPMAAPAMNGQKALYSFTTQPTSSYDGTNQQFIVSWTTDFVPEKAEIGYLSSDGAFHASVTVSPVVNQSASVGVPMDKAETRMVVRAYWGTYLYVDSSVFDTGLDQIGFTMQPTSIFNGPNNIFHLSWETNYIPTKVEIGYMIADGSFGIRETITSGFSTYMTFDLAVNKVETLMVVRAYYGTSRYKDSSAFAIGTDRLKFTSQPSVIFDTRDSQLLISWETTFIPTKVEIGAVGSGGSFAVKETVTANLGKKMTCSLSMDKMTPQMKVRAYYSNGNYRDSDVFATGQDQYRFTEQPSSSYNGSSGFLVSWKTNFTPSKVEIGYKDTYDQFYPVETMTGTISPGTGKLVPLDKAVWSMYVRAYYGSSVYRESEVFNVGFDRLGFSQQPDFTYERQQGTQGSTGVFHLSWGTNFNPKKIEIGFKDSSNIWHKVAEISSGLGWDMTYDYTRTVDRQTTYYVRAWCNDYYSRDSTGFKFAPDFIFLYLEHGDPHPLLDEGGILVNWKTNFVPEMVEIDKYNGTEWETVTLLYNDMAASMSHTMYYDDFGQRIRFRAWNGPQDYADREETVFITPRRFETQPVGGSIAPGLSRIINWKTNFNPTKVEIGYYNGTQWVSVDTLTSDLRLNMSYPLAYDDAHPTMRVRAYGNATDYAESNDFSMSIAARQFTRQPTGGTVYPWTTLPLDWTLNYVPDRVEIGYRSGSSWILKATLTENLALSGHYDLSYALAVSSSAWEVRAYYGNLSISSASFSVQKRSNYVCGSNLTAVLDGHRLRFSGSGAMYDFNDSGNRPPWYNERESIVSVIFPTGVTYIGNYAFASCGKIVTVTMPDDLTGIGKYAFSSCARLASINLPEGLTAIKEGAFGGCELLSSIAFPSTLSEIGASAFSGCASITKFNFQGGAPSIGSQAFANIAATAYYIAGMPNWNDGVLLNYGGTITWRALQKCGDHLSWVLEDGLLTISGEGDMWDFSGDYVPGWYGLRNDITSVDIRHTVTSIGAFAFDNLSSLTSVNVGQGVTSVGNYAFRSCSSLNNVIFNGPAPSFNVRSFYAVTVNAYYIPGDSWTSSVRQNYGGTVTWIATKGQCGRNAFWTIDEDHVLHISGSGPMDNWLGLYNMSGSDNEPWDKYAEEIIAVEIEDGITTIGNYAFYSNTALISVSIPDSVTRIGDHAFDGDSLLMSAPLPANLESIGECAFYKCVLVDGMSFPAGLKTIGRRAFYRCSSLSGLTLPDGLTTIGPEAFCFCTSFTGTLVIPDSVTSLGYEAFYYCSALEHAVTPALPYGFFFQCTSLKSVTLPDGLTSVGQNTFWGCTSLEEIALPDSVTTIGQGAFAYSGLKQITIPTSVTEIGPMAFSGCSMTDACYYGSEEQWNAQVTLGYSNTNLTNVLRFVRLDGVCGAEGDNLRFILYYDGRLVISGSGDMKDYANNTGSSTAWFGAKSHIQSVVIEEGVTGVGNYAFWNCVNMTSLELPDSVSRLGSCSFMNCSQLTDIVIPDAVAIIPYECFMRCTSLQSVTLPQSLSEFGLYAFQYCEALESIAIPYGVTKLSTYCFANCSSLTEVTIPESVTSFGDYVFARCSSLENILLPGGLTMLGSSSFSNCTSLKSIVIPANVTSVPYMIFYNCPALTTVFFEGSATSFGTDPFGNDTATVYYPQDDASWTEAVRQNYGGTLTWVGAVPINSAHFPDANFRGMVKNAFDQNHDGWFTADEISAVDAFGCEDTDFTTLKGIEYFTDLAFLMVDGAPSLTGVDLRSNTALMAAEVFNNALTELRLDGLTALNYLSCEGNALSYLDVREFALTDLLCYDNPLETLILGEQPRLKRLYCFNTELAVLDILDCPYLLDAYLNGTVTTEPGRVKYVGPLGGTLYLDPTTEVLTPGCVSVDASHFPDPGFLSYVAQYCDADLNQWLTPGELAAVTAIDCSGRDIASLAGVGYFTELVSLTCSDNPVTGLDLSGNAALTHLYCAGCDLTELDLSHTPDMEVLFCPGNPNLSSLSLAATPKLLETALEGRRNDFTDGGYDAWSFTLEPYRLLVDKGLLLTRGGVAPDYDGFLPAAMKTLEEEALAGCAFQAVRIPDGAVEIGARAFAGAPNLAYVYIPASVTAIASDAFDQVTGLTIIGAAGSAAENVAAACGFVFAME